MTCFFFLEYSDIANYADDSTPHNPDKNFELFVNNLEHLPSVLSKWLNDNYMKVNFDKSHLLVSGNLRTTAEFDNKYIECEK